MTNRSLSIKARFALVMVVFVIALVSASWVGIVGLQAQRSAVTKLYTANVIHSENASSLATSLGGDHAATLQLLLAPDHPAAVRVNGILDRISSTIGSLIVTLRSESAGNRSELALVQVISADWNYLQGLRTDGSLSGTSAAARATELKQVENIYAPMTSAANAIIGVEAGQAKTSYLRAISNYNSSVRLMLLVLAFVLLVAGGILTWLIRSVLSRTLAYSAFAKKVTEGDFTQRLFVRGGDELDELGTTLDHLARRWEFEDHYEKAKLEFAAAMQSTENEQEARSLLKQHLERTIAQCTITILNRDNSTDRLEAVTELAQDSPLIHSLEEAKPRSCLAIRMARTHRGTDGEDVLMPCKVCLECSGETACTPLLVSGEVIGAVLANHSSNFATTDERTVQEAIMLSAPILGNLRNLAIAETRAETDGLTGLPNRRSLEESMVRMVAQASRTVEPLAALMCDLDNFKLINDRYGHGKGDEVLAAVGSAFRSTVRASDLVGRYGGEEFLILLPATGSTGAVEMAERMRIAISNIHIPGVEQRISMSVGVAVMPEHAADGPSLSKASDQALYEAKDAGRDRVAVFTPPPQRSSKTV